MRILVAEDAVPLARSVAQGLGEEGFTVDVTHDGAEALHLASEIAFDAIILDRGLPSMDGLAVLRALRAKQVRTPVLILTALGEVHDRVDGLDAGGDDYLVKPFAFAELLARVRALLRRGYGQGSNVVTVGRLALDLSSHTATVDGRPLELTSREFAVLELFALKPGATWTRTQLVERLYDEGSDRDSNVIDVFVARLRKKLEAAGLPGSAMIRTQRGLGYRFDPAAGEGGDA